MFFLGWVHAWRGEVEAVSALVERQRRLAEVHGISEWSSTGELLVALPAMRADREGGGPEARRWLEEVREAGGLRAPLKLALLAEVIARDDPPLALSLVEEALVLTARTGERWSEPEILRIEGVIALGAGERERGRDRLERAYRLARRQGALGWALRSAIDLARLARGGPQAAAARARRAEVAGGFEEAADVADVRAAEALLAAG
jgi:hypothetical protein